MSRTRLARHAHDHRTRRPGSCSALVEAPGPTSALYYSGNYLWGTIATADSVARVDARRAGNPVTSLAGHRPAQMVTAGGHLFVAPAPPITPCWVFDPRSAKQVRAPLEVENNPSAMAADDRAVWVTGIAGTVTRIVYR